MVQGKQAASSRSRKTRLALVSLLEPARPPLRFVNVPSLDTCRAVACFATAPLTDGGIPSSVVKIRVRHIRRLVVDLRQHSSSDLKVPNSRKVVPASLPCRPYRSLIATSQSGLLVHGECPLSGIWRRLIWLGRLKYPTARWSELPGSKRRSHLPHLAKQHISALHSVQDTRAP